MLQPGDVLKDTYRVEALCAQGGMAFVYKVEHLALGVKRALKVLQPQFSRDEECVARFRKEAQIMAQLRHPHIAEVHDCGVTSDGLVYLVMEWLEGEDLSQLMKREPRQSLPFVLKMCREVGAALAASHKVGVVHRDLKPGNIFLGQRHEDDKQGSTGDGLLFKVVDFGIARLLHAEAQRPDVTLPGSMLGTPGYMAPEQLIEALGPVAPSSDQFALAVIAYELLIGERLFVSHGQDVGALYEMAQRMMVGALPPLPPEADSAGAALRQALRHKPEARFASVDQFVAALEQPIVTPQPQTPQPSVGTPWPVASQTAVRQRSRRGGMVVAAAALGCVLLIGLCSRKPGLKGSLLQATEAFQRSAPQPEIAPRIPSVQQQPLPPPGAPTAPCPTGVAVVQTRDQRPAGTVTAALDRWQKVMMLRCVRSLHLQSQILAARGAEVVLRRTGVLLVASEFPNGPTQLLEHCLEQRLGKTSLPKEVHIKVTRDLRACDTESRPDSGP